LKATKEKTENTHALDIPNREDEDASTGKSHRMPLLKMLMLSGGPFLYFFGFHHILKRNYIEGLLDVAGGAAVTIAYIILKQNRGGLIIARLLGAAIGFLFIYFLTIHAEMPYRALWSYIYPLVVLFILGKPEGVIWAAAFYFIAASLLFVSDLPLVPFHYDPEFRIRFLITLGLVFVMSFMFETVRHKTEEKMVQKQHSLERSEAMYRSAFHELKEVQAQLIQSAKLASIGELASGVAHELNQPLMVIRGTAQLIQRNLRKNNLNNAELTEQLDPIERNTKRMMNIINHLRTFSRQSKGKFSRLDMNRVAKGSFTLINEQLRLHNIEVIEEYASDLPPIQGDETQIEQVIINLIANARDAMDKREADSDVDDKTKKTLKISTSKARDNSHLEMRITDSGEGIAPGDLDRVFDPFFTTKEVGKGTGLGLSISYGIIKEHGGEIEVAETGPEGTTFRIKLPIVA